MQQAKKKAPSKQKIKNKKTATAKVSYNRKADDLTLDQWQIALRRQFAEMKSFVVSNKGANIVFSDYHVFNSETNNTYKVAIRSAETGANFCTCLDFKTNDLGTCKHIEYVLHQIKNNSRKAKLLKQGYHPHYTSVFLKYGKERKVCLRIGSEKHEDFKKSAEKYFDKNNILKEGQHNNIEQFLEKAHALHPDFRCYPDALAFMLAQREAESRIKIVEKAFLQKNKFLDSIIKATLFPYQKDGIEFAIRKGRCLLADDMGLGKTIQAIGAAEGMKKLFGISKVLIVCPTSLKYQWKSEIEKFTDSDLLVIEGNLLTREKQYADESFYKICSYNVVGRDISTINKNEFDLIILDEAQRVKNWQTNTAKNIKKVITKYSLVLTGTPLENKLEELYSVVQVVDQFQLGALFRFVHEHQITDALTGKVIGYKDLNKIGELLKGIMLRRHKRDVLKQLPSRMDKNLFVPMTEKQLDVYNDAQEKVKRLVQKWINYKFLKEEDRQRLLINLNIMRMACDSTFVLDQETRHDTKIEELMNILEEVFANGDDKVVVFSQWERMTRIVAMELDARKIRYESLHGSVPSKDREILFKNFNTIPESKVFLSTDAGGVGLNLQAASVLINLDLPWNPAVLEQRIGRIHRMGQKKNVQIINLISKDTIEEEMLNKLKFKSAMATGILDNGESTVFSGESKFNELMKQVQKLTDHEPQLPETLVETEYFEKEVNEIEKNQTSEIKQPIQAVLFDEDVIKETVQSVMYTSPAAHNETKDLLQSGSAFFSNLLETLSDKSKTENLLNSLVKKDESTGETYLKIPVKDSAIVENGLKLLGQLLGSIKQK